MENVREIGAEWLCSQVLQRLDIDAVLQSKQWKSNWITDAKVAIISRAIFASNEHPTAQWLEQNSALLEAMRITDRKVNRHHLYKAATRLYEIKEEIEKHIYNKTLDLFEQEDTLAIYDLTNTYFESPKRNSAIAKYGKSKEKRNDCKQVVLAAVINRRGFVKYSQIYEGNMSDSKTLKDIIGQLQSHKTEYTL